VRRRERPETPWGARLLAPAAFLAAATVAIVLIRSGLDRNDAPVRSQRPAATRTATGPTTTTRARPPAQGAYTIRAGDTLDQIALAHDTTVERLLELNPRLDPTSLQVGQRIVVPR
jgi:LysM repeat protein